MIEILTSSLNLLMNLLQYVTLLLVIFYILFYTKLFKWLKIEDTEQKPNIRRILILIIIFGGLSIYATVIGRQMAKVIANNRDLAPVIAGLLGGPWAGLGAGLLGGIHRMTLGGYTGISDGIVTILAGLTGGIIYLICKRRFPSFIAALLIGFTIQVFHMMLVFLCGVILLVYNLGHMFDIQDPIRQALIDIVEVGIPMIISNAIGLSLFAFMINNYKQQQELQAKNQRIESELKVAESIQASFLPRIFPPFPKRKEFEIFASMDPAKEVGGDFYDFFLIDDKKLFFVIADVSGKSIPGALFMVITKTLIRNESKYAVSPAEILIRVNSTLYPDNDESMFVTAFCAILDITTGELEYANAGHNPPLLCLRGGGFEFMKLIPGSVLAAFPKGKFKNEKINMVQGSKIFLYTDGVNEAMNSNQQQFSNSRLKEALGECQDKNMEQMIQAVKQAVKDFVGQAPQTDDITMLALEYFGKQ